MVVLKKCVISMKRKISSNRSIISMNEREEMYELLRQQLYAEFIRVDLN